MGWISALEWWRSKPRTEAYAQRSWSCVPGGSRACQGQAVSWLDHCWAPGSVLSWKPLTHAVILDMKLSGSASLVQCSLGTVLMQHCCCLGCGSSVGPRTSARTGCSPETSWCGSGPVLSPQTHLVLCAGSLASSCANAQTRAGNNKPETSWP